MTVKGGTTPACAACKYQRRRCVPTCPLAPYFPSNQHKTFQNVHRLFGVSNVTKTLKGLHTDDQREDAIKSIIFEADMRERYPVHGCSTIIFQLRFQLHYALQELNCLHAQLANCREQRNKQVDHWTPQQHLTTYSSGADSMPVIYNNQSATSSEGPQFFVNESNGFYGESFDNMSKPMLGLEHFDGVSNNSNNLVALQEQMDAFGIQGRETLINQEYEGMAFNMIDDDRQSYIDTIEPCESCSESSQKGTNMSVQQVCKNELRSAAAGFSLTTVN